MAKNQMVMAEIMCSVTITVRKEEKPGTKQKTKHITSGWAGCTNYAQNISLILRKDREDKSAH